jgi:hypothetical protein
MFFNLPFGNAQAVRKVPGGTPRAGDRLHDLLSDSEPGVGHVAPS